MYKTHLTNKLAFFLFRQERWAILASPFNGAFSKLIGIVLLACLAGQPVAAQVNVYLKNGGTGSGTSWANAGNAATYLNNLTTNATAITQNTTIRIEGDATYQLPDAGNQSLLFNTSGITVTMIGGFNPTDHSYDPINHPTTIRGSSNVWAHSMFGTSTNTNKTVKIKGFSLDASMSGSGYIFGAGYAQVGTPFLGDFTFEDITINAHPVASYGFFFLQDIAGGSSLTLNNCYFANNVGGNSQYGAIIQDGTRRGNNPTAPVPITINNCSIINNSSTSSGNTGGIIAILGPTVLKITDSYFCGNYTTSGHGGALGVNNDAATVEITGCTFKDNHTNPSNYNYGGAIALVRHGGTAKFTNCWFSGNYVGIAQSSGGAIAQDDGDNSPVTITNSTFYNNYGTGGGNTLGGAIATSASNGGMNTPTYAISNCKFIANKADLSFGYRGGAIAFANYSGAASLVLTNNLFYNNTVGGSTTANGADLAVSHGESTRGKVTGSGNIMQNSAGSYIAYPNSPSTSPFQWGTNTYNNNTTGNNGGVTGTVPNCPTSINAVSVSVTGQVWDDADGNVALNGSETGTNASGPLYVNLVDGTGTVVASTTVSASGAYTLTAPTSTTGLKLVLSNSPTATTPGPLPTGWVNTGEIAGSGNLATQSATLGQIELSTGTTAVMSTGFGIEKLPMPGSGTATVGNPGGTAGIIIPPSAFTSVSPSTDTAPGSVTAIRITAFPSNVTSLTINGTVYTSLPAGGIVVPTNSSGAPTVPILIDPTNDSNPASFSYVAVDNAGKESANTGTATINSSLLVSVQGSVWNDADGSVTLNGSETGTNAGGPLYVNLVDGTGTVVASTTVSASGNYTLTAPASTTGLKLVLSTSATAATPGPLPTGWVNTGENAGSGNSATQSATLGQVELSTGTTTVTGASFGIEQTPTTGSGTATVSNSGGISPVTVPPSAFTSTSASTDTAPGSVTAIRITAFPSNVTSLTINGTVYTSLPAGSIIVPTNSSGAPSVPILIDPTNDSNPVSFSFVAVDNAGKESTTTGTAVLLAAPDLTPIIYARPSSVYKTTPMTVVVDVVEILNVASSGLITVKVTRDSKLSLSLDPLASVVDGRSVQNGVWSLDSSDPSYYVLTTSQSVGAYGTLSFGLSGRLTPGSTTGVLTVSAVIVGGSGGEVRVDNNADADKIDYFQQ